MPIMLSRKHAVILLLDIDSPQCVHKLPTYFYDFGFWHPKHCIGTGRHAGANTLHRASEVIFKCLESSLSVGPFKKLAVLLGGASDLADHCIYLEMVGFLVFFLELGCQVVMRLIEAWSLRSNYLIKTGT